MQHLRQVLAEWHTPLQIRWQLNALHARRDVRILCHIVTRWRTETLQKINLIWSLALTQESELRSRLLGAFLHWKCQIAVRWALKGFMVCITVHASSHFPLPYYV